ncbi:hypothetical protein [Paenibacillus antarcticus]|uniref:Uncharacterized protein n=1 Tax=Paenibacillus antarcticus TaxID=253703 RepID=A0A168QTY7_9BACL|nr:hypothetical protein [Paenibacillus antarcticus]OAB48203.1 hypothetical protein PBAT_00755 [Paenibacillus antarcticus]
MVDLGICSNWTEIDSKDNEVFFKRHQKIHYFLDSNTAYQYYRLELQNNSGDKLQVGEVTLSSTKDKWHAIDPIYVLNDIDTADNSHLFEEALPNYQQEITAIARDVASKLFNDPKELTNNPKKIDIGLHTPGDVAGTDSQRGYVDFSSTHLRDTYNVTSTIQPLRMML